MSRSTSEGAWRSANRAFHVALPLLLLGLLAGLPLLERLVETPSVAAGLALVVALPAAVCSIDATRRLIGSGRLSELLLTIGFGALAATYTFAAITVLTSSNRGLAPHDTLGRLVLGLMLVVAARSTTSERERTEVTDPRRPMIAAVAAFIAIELVLMVSAVLGTLRLPDAQVLGAAGRDVLRLVDLVNVALFTLAAPILALNRAHAGRAAATVGASLLAVGTVILLVARAGTLDSALGQLTIAVALVTCRTGFAPRRHRSLASLRTGIEALAGRLEEGVFLFDDALRLEWVNAAGARLTGLLPAAIGGSAAEIFGREFGDGATPAHATRTPAPASVAVEAPGTGRPLELGISWLHRGDDETSGFLVVARDLLPEQRTGDELERLSEALAQALSERDDLERTVDFQRAELARLTTQDPISGVANEELILSRLRGEIAQARRHPHPVAIVLVEIAPVDGPGKDTAVTGEGAAGGEVPLREVALRLQLRLREGDALGRVRDRNFLIVLPHTDERGVGMVAESIRERIERDPIGGGNGSLRVRAWLGTAVLRPGVEISAEELLQRAESRLEAERAASAPPLLASPEGDPENDPEAQDGGE